MLSADLLANPAWDYQWMATDETPMGRLREAARQYRRAEAAMAKRRDELHAAVIAALMAEERPRDVVEVTGLTQEHVRRLAREHGVPPRGAGGKL